jgi:hypothetical protein
LLADGNLDNFYFENIAIVCRSELAFAIHQLTLELSLPRSQKKCAWHQEKRDAACQQLISNTLCNLKINK